MNRLRELKAKAHNLKPVVRIGKNGLTATIIKEIDTHLKKRKLIKIKILKSALEKQDKKGILNEILDKTKAEMVQMVGFTISIHKK